MSTESDFVELLDRLHDVMMLRFRLSQNVEEAVTSLEDHMTTVEGRLTLIEKNWE